MKDSGIPWIGEIPSHWDTCFIKQVMRNKSVKGYPDEQVLSLYRDYGVVPKDSRDDNHNVTSEDTSGYKLVDVGDFVINKMKAWQGSMAVSGYRGIISPAYYICRFTAPVYKKYIHFLLRNETYKAEYMRLSTGLRVGQWDLNVDDFLHIPMVLPPVHEQQSIADFLDKKCGEIDEMVSLQEKIIEELKAYKQSVITEAVCKGLNPDVPMKDSGLEWEGEVPHNWQKVFLKWFFLFEKGKNAALYTADYIGQHEGDYVVYSGQTENEGIMGRIDTYDYDIEECLFTTTVGGRVMTPRLLHGKFSLSQNCLIMKNKGEISNHFIYYLLIALFAYEKSLIPSYMQPSLRIEDLKTYTFFLPPFKEQQSIADFLDTKCAEIDTLISLKQSKIDALKEYKKSNIYEYITGKKEING